MTDQEIRDIWMNSGNYKTIEVSLPELIGSLKKKLKNKDRVLFWRDGREIIAALAVIVIFGYQIIIENILFSKIISGMIIVWSFFIIYKLMNVRKYKKVIDLSEPFRNQIQKERIYLEQQSNLLNSILYWYVGPFALLYAISIISREFTGEFDSSYLLSIAPRLGILFLLSWGLYILNKKAAKSFIPLIENIDNVLLQLDED